MFAAMALTAVLGVLTSAEVRASGSAFITHTRALEESAHRGFPAPEDVGNQATACVSADGTWENCGPVYESESGVSRWLSPDPEWLKQGPMGLNPYQYAYWNPVRFTDPDGRAARPMTAAEQKAVRQYIPADRVSDSKLQSLAIHENEEAPLVPGPLGRVLPSVNSTKKALMMHGVGAVTQNGSDIYLAPGTDLESPAYLKTLVHEVDHVATSEERGLVRDTLQSVGEYGIALVDELIGAVREMGRSISDWDIQFSFERAYERTSTEQSARKAEAKVKEGQTVKDFE